MVEAHATLVASLALPTRSRPTALCIRIISPLFCFWPARGLASGDGHAVLALKGKHAKAWRAEGATTILGFLTWAACLTVFHSILLRTTTWALLGCWR